MAFQKLNLPNDLFLLAGVFFVSNLFIRKGMELFFAKGVL